MLNPSIERWIFASISKHFDDRKGNIHLYVEGMLRDTRTIEEVVELRVDGPNYLEMSKGYWKVYIEVNALCQCTKNSKNFHRMRQLTGTVMAMFEACIQVYKYGDDGSFVGVFKRLDDTASRNMLQVSHFGQVDPVNQLEQASIEGHYEMFLEE